jgi:hypothetical protein
VYVGSTDSVLSGGIAMPLRRADRRFSGSSLFAV